MRSLRNACVAMLLSSILSAMGCCYHAQHFGRARHIGVGEAGCDTCETGDDCCSTSGEVITHSPSKMPNPGGRPERLP
jgi:hypothetical protein